MKTDRKSSVLERAATRIDKGRFQIVDKVLSDPVIFMALSKDQASELLDIDRRLIRLRDEIRTEARQ